MPLSFARLAVGVLAALVFGGSAAHAAAVHPDSTTVVATVTGTVIDSAGAPLANARVSVIALDISTTTDGGGRFSLGSLRPGRYHLVVQLIGYAPAHEDVVVGAGSEPVRLSITLHATALTLSGVLVTAVPTATDPLNVAQATTELSGAELSRRVSSSVAKTLEGEPGISVRYNGPAASAPVIRGLQGDRKSVV